MPTDYSNNKVPKDQETSEKTTNKDLPPKKIENVVVGEIIVRKKTVGRKLKDLIVSADLKGVAAYLLRENVIPGAKRLAYNLWVDGGTQILYPNAPNRRPLLDPRSIGGAVQRSIINYGGMSNSPISRSANLPFRDPRMAPAREIGPRASAAIIRPGEQYAFANRADAVRVLEILTETIDKYEVPVSLGDLYEAMGQPNLGSHADQKWGWTNLANVKILQAPEGYLLDFPPVEQIS